MVRQIVNINWRYIGDAVPAFVTVMFIPFGYSAAYGLIAGLMTYTALNGLVYLTKLITRGYIVPEDEDQREYWTIIPHGRLPWFVTATQAVAQHVSHRQETKLAETASTKSGGSRRFGSQSKDSDTELNAVVVIPRDPRDEKVLRKT